MEIVKTERQAVYTLQGVHDGFLCGICISGEDELQLDFKNLEGEKWRLVVPRILALKAENFREGNIVLDVDLYEGDVCPPEYLSQAFGYNEEEREKYLPQKLQELGECSWILIEVSASYGCELFALSRNSITDLAVQDLRS